MKQSRFSSKAFTYFFIFMVIALSVCAVFRGLGAHNRDWAIGAVALYIIPLILLWINKTGLRITGGWFGIFLIGEFILSVFFMQNHYKTLPPNMDQKLEIVGDVMPGFEGVQHITTDEKGFRVTRTINYYEKPKNTLRVFAIGGSTTEQIYLDDHKTWTHLLQEKLQQANPEKTVEVINTGLSGLRAEHHLATLKEISNYKPDLVLFLVGVNDWNRQIRFTLNDDLRKKAFYLRISPEESLIGRAIKIAKAMRKNKDTQGNPNEVKKVDGAYYASLNNSFTTRDFKSFSPTQVSAFYAETIEKIMGICKDADFKCVFLTQPNGYQPNAETALQERFWMTPPKENYTIGEQGMQNIARLYNEFLLKRSKQSGLSACDIANQLPATTEFFYDDCHYNERGAQHVATFIYQCLESR